MIPILTNSALLSAPPFGPAQVSIWPLVIIALLIDSGIVAIWYMAGFVLNNQRVKTSAKGEFYQIVETAIIAGLVLGLLLVFGQLFLSIINAPMAEGFTCTGSSATGQTALSQTCMVQLCNSLSTSTSSSTSFEIVNSLLENLQPGICTIVSGSTQSPTGMQAMEYPLAATGVVLANLTNQTSANLNSTFVEDAFLNFLQHLSITASFCVQLPDSFSCYVPLPGAPPQLFMVVFSAAPMAGLEMITRSLATYATLLYTSLFSFITQLLFVNFFLYIWPYLIFGGMVLRATFFTRKVGGLLIAFAVGGILFYPAIFSIEYLAANNPQITSPNTFYYCGGSQYQYTENFFVAPQVKGIAQDCGCWPSGGLINSEGTDFLILGIGSIVFWGAAIGSAVVNIFLGIFKDITSQNWGGIPSSFEGAIVGAAPIFPSNFASQLSSLGGAVCPLGGENSGAEGMLFAIVQTYGVTGVVSYFLPILNIMVTLSAIFGMSGLMGGETNVLGLSRFV